MFVPIFIVLAIFVTRLLPLAGDGAGIAAVANLSPLIALTLCGTAFFRHRWAMVLPLGAILLSDIILNAGYGMSLVGSYTVVALAVYGAVALSGLLLRKASRPLPLLLGATVGGVLAFYLVTNTVSFLMEPLYPRNFGGWVQCMTVGLPGYPPTWSFLVKSLVANVVFAAIFCYVFKTVQAPKSKAEPEPEPEREAIRDTSPDPSVATL